MTRATYMMEALERVTELRDRGALFVLSNSGGKDSQVQNIIVEALVPKAQRLTVYAELGDETVWPATKAHIEATIDSDFIVCKAVDAAGLDKGFFDLLDMNMARFVRQNSVGTNPWPEPTIRQCTSDLKTNPIDKAIRAAVKGLDNKLVVSCIGIRGTESAKRAPGFGTKENPSAFKFSKKLSKAGREVYEWLPIHDFRCRTDRNFIPGLTKDDVFDTIRDAGQEPFWTYEAGMTRLSCSFCIMSSKTDVATAARLRPTLYAAYVAKEMELGFTMMMPGANGPVFLEEFCGVKADPKLVEEFLASFAAAKPSRNRRVLAAYLAQLSKVNRAILTGSELTKAEATGFVTTLTDDEVTDLLNKPAFEKEEAPKADDSALAMTCDAPDAPAAPVVISLGSTRMGARTAPAPRVAGSKLNEKEELVLSLLSDEGLWSLKDLAEVAGLTNSNVRNSLRKLLRNGLVEKAFRGTYRATTKLAA